MTSIFKATVAAAALAVTAGAAQAATVTIEDFTAAAFTAASAGAAATTVEDFEAAGASLGEGQITSDLAIAIGTVGVIGGTGDGASVTGDGTDLAIRDGNNFGRTNTTAGGEWFLDSNDTHGALLNVVAQSVGFKFNKVFFSITDGTDVGAIVRVTETAGGVTNSFLSQLNGNQKLVSIVFDSAISTAKIEIGNVDAAGLFVVNDGYGLDDITAAFIGDSNELEPVPLPAAGLLLLTALGGLGVARRRKVARKAA